MVASSARRCCNFHVGVSGWRGIDSVHAGPFGTAVTLRGAKPGFGSDVRFLALVYPAFLYSLIRPSTGTVGLADRGRLETGRVSAPGTARSLLVSGSCRR